MGEYSVHPNSMIIYKITWNADRTQLLTNVHPCYFEK